MTTFIARTPVDLLALVPPAIGFHPEQSVVLITFGHDPAFHVRLDLPLEDRSREEVTVLLRDLVLGREVERVALVLYTDDAAAAGLLSELLVPALLGVGVEVVDVLRVDDGRYFAADDPADPGTAYDLADHPYLASHRESGRVVHESRGALAATLLGGDPGDVAAVSAAADRTADRLLVAGKQVARTQPGKRTSLARVLADELAEQGRWLQQRIRSALESPEEIPATDAGRMLVLVALQTLREVAWAEIDRTSALAHVGLWRALVRRAPADLRAAPAGLLGFAAWLDGQGALAWCALERCFEQSPDDTLGQQVAALLESAAPPTAWRPIAQSELRAFS